MGDTEDKNEVITQENVASVDVPNISEEKNNDNLRDSEDKTKDEHDSNESKEELKETAYIEQANSEGVDKSEKEREDKIEENTEEEPKQDKECEVNTKSNK